MNVVSRTNIIEIIIEIIIAFIISLIMGIAFIISLITGNNPADVQPVYDYEQNEVYESEQTADMDVDGYIEVFTVGVRQIFISDGDITVDSYDLDDLELGVWLETKNFRVCEYAWHQLGTTSPEHWYLIDVLNDDVEITLEGYGISYVWYHNDTDNECKYKSDYEDNYGEGCFYIKDGVVEYYSIQDDD